MLKNKIILAISVLILATSAVSAPIVTLGMITALLVVLLCWLRPGVGVTLALLSTAIGEFGRITIGNVAILPLDLIAPIVLATWVLRKLIKKESIQFDQTTKWLTVFWAVAGASLIFGSSNLSGSELKIAFFYFIRFISISGVFFVARDLVNQKKQIFLGLVGAVLLLAFGGFYLFQVIPDFTEAGLTELGWDPHIGRLTGTWLDPNFAAGAFAFVLALLGSYFLSTKKFLAQVWVLGVAGILFVALLMTFSRSGLLAFGIAGLILGFLRSRTLLIAGVILVMIGVSISPRLSERLDELTQSAINLSTESEQVLDPTAKLRIDSWQEGLRIWREHPLLGSGYGTYQFHQTFADSESHAATGSDSSLLNIAATTGIAGLLTFLAFLVSLASTAWRTRKDWLSLGLLAGGSGFLIHAIFVNSLFFPPLTLFFFVTAGLVKSEQNT